MSTNKTLETTRRAALTSVAAFAATVPAAATAISSLPASTAGQDAELRRLYAVYVKCLAAENEARVICRADRKKFRAWNLAVYATHGVIEKIRATPAESIVGIGVKLAALEGPAGVNNDDDEIEDYEFKAVHAVALDDIDRITGLNFVDTTPAGIVEDEEDRDPIHVAIAEHAAVCAQFLETCNSAERRQLADQVLLAGRGLTDAVPTTIAGAAAAIHYLEQWKQAQMRDWNQGHTGSLLTLHGALDEVALLRSVENGLTKLAAGAVAGGAHA
jgi:hypothetical protein